MVGGTQPPATTVEGGDRPSEAEGGVRPAVGGSREGEVDRSSPSSSEKEKSNCSSSERASTKPSSSASDPSSTEAVCKGLGTGGSSGIGGRNADMRFSVLLLF
jgi:hypothetical protein